MEDLGVGLENRSGQKKGGRGLLIFLIGLAVGVAGALLLPRYLAPYLPAGLGRGTETVEGPVLGKRMEGDRLLLTVRAEQGAALATFRERVSEIDLLVDVGDTITLGVARYEPFIDDPAFRAIRKAAPTPAATQRETERGPSERPGDAVLDTAAVSDTGMVGDTGTVRDAAPGSASSGGDTP